MLMWFIKKVQSRIYFLRSSMKVADTSRLTKIIRRAGSWTIFFILWDRFQPPHDP